MELDGIPMSKRASLLHEVPLYRVPGNFTDAIAVFARMCLIDASDNIYIVR